MECLSIPCWRGDYTADTDKLYFPNEENLHTLGYV